jgi:magnesium-protoporphyrin O-methyltransferase
MADYAATRDRVEDYFDRSATKVWARLTTDAPVSRIRQTVRIGRDQMRAVMLSRLPTDLSGARILDAGCGTGMMTAELAARGANVVAVDIAPQLIDIARQRLAPEYAGQVTFGAGDMTDDALGQFDYVVAMDSLIYYNATDIGRVLDKLATRTAQTIVFTVAPKTPFLMVFWHAGKLFPRSDRSPVMIPHALPDLARTTRGNVTRVERVSSGFYTSDCLEYRA